MKAQKHISCSILCALTVIVCIAIFAACTFLPEAHMHEWSKWTVSKEPTCTVAGEESRTCRGCGETETRSINVLEHKWNDPTCTSPKTCAVCGSSTGETLQHNYTREVAKKEALKSEATCTKAAVYYKSCSCGKISNSEKDTFVSGKPLAHTYNVELVKAEALKSEATCTQAAIYYKSCSCGKISNSEKDTFVSGKPLAHTYNQEVAKEEALKSEATCTKAAVYYKSCSCGKVSTSENDTFVFGTPTPHVFDQEIAKDETLKSPATPTSAAVYYKSCVCGAISKDAKDTFTYGKPGDHTHSYTSKVTPPTCSEYGYTVYTCECGYTYKEIGTTLAEHVLVKNADPVLYLAKDATCDAPAEYYYSCSVCGACVDSEGAETFTDGEALGHDYVWKSNGDGTHIGTCQNYGCQKTVTDNCSGGAATCTQKAICEVCQEYYGAALGHNWKDGEVLSAATCTLAGQKTQICQNEGCSATTTVTVPALGHNYQSAVTAPTCAAQGYTTYTCNTCSHSYVGDYVAMLPHSYSDWTQTQAPTCTETGIKTRTCSCGASETETVEALGHNYTSVVTAPTCTSQGYTTYTCQNAGCNHSYEGDYVTVSHQWNIEAPTCTQDQVCSICSAKNEATGHSYELSGGTDATCTKAATKIYQCANCEDSYTETVGTPIAHNITDVTPTLVPVEGETCLFVEHYACADCGADVVGGEVEKHNSYVATIQTAATCITEGVKVLTCGDCGETKTEAIPVDTTLGHAWVAGDVADGKRTDTCSICDTQKTITIVTENQTNKAEDLKDTELSVGGTNINFGAAADSIGNQTQNDVTVGAGTLGEDEKQNLGLDADKLAQIGDNPIYNFTVTDTENNLITNFGENVYVTISIPYTLKDGEDIDSIAIWFISDSGEIEAIPATYNNGYITFKTNHFSYYTATDLDPDERCEVYGHNFKFGAPVAPTCTESGYTIRYCIRCRYSDMVDIVDPVGHDFQATTVRAATCAQEGLIRHTCSGCRQSYEERIPVLEHDYQFVSETSATCTVAGTITYQCTLCKNQKITQIDPLGHDCKATRVVDPTCTAKGYTVYTCQNSGCTYSYTGDYKEVVAHSFGEWTVVRPATCTKTGVQRHICTDCNRSETQVIPIADHDYATVVTAPTCDTAGYTTYTCSGCQNSYVGDHQDPTGHKYEATWEWAEDKSSAQITLRCENEGCRYFAEPLIEIVVSEHTVFDSTEKKDGRREDTVRYEHDGKSFSDTKTETIPKKKHDHKDCEWQHNKFTHWYKCKDSKGNSQKIPHVFDNGTVIEAATCQKAGKILYKCECGYEKTETIPATDAHVAGDQTYHNGEKHWNVCTECSQKFGEAKHEWDEGTETKSATCTEKGSITYTCACGATKDAEIPALGHTEEILPGKEATCTENGLTEGKKCSVCDIVIVPQAVIPAPGHKFEDGYCTECGLSEIPPHEHFFDNACDTDCNFDGCKFTRDTEHVFDHDCDEVCDECGFKRKTEHVYDNACDPDCNVDGCGYVRMIYTHYFDHDCDEVCNECGYVRYVDHIFDNVCDNECNNPFCNYVRTVSEHEYYDGYCIYCGASEVEPHEHFFSNDCDTACDFTGCHFVRVAPHVYSNDCDTTCDVCGFERWVPYHNYIETERLDETCTTDGYAVYTCSSCGDFYTNILYAHGHYVSDYEIIKEATCTENGEQQGACDYCGETITETIWATGHNTQYEYADFATLGITCGGWSERGTCQTCNAWSYFYINDYYCAWEQTSYDEATNTYTYTCLNCGAVKKRVQTYDYHDTCRYTTTEVYEYYVGDELVWYGGSQWGNESHTWDYTFEMQGTSCTDGYNVTEFCVDCGQINYTSYGNDHNYYCVERYEFADYGACYGYLYIYQCPCGENAYTNTSYCGLNHVSSESYTDDAGVEHWLETYACPTCNLTRVRDYYMQREGCYTYCYETYTFQMGDTVIGSYENRWQSNSHHEYEYTYVFIDETNRNCEAGVTVTQTCRNCDYRNEHDRWYHGTDLVAYYDFTEYGACYGYLSIYSCPCGKSQYTNQSWCGMSYVSETTYTDAQGREHTIYTEACSTCGLTRVRDYYMQREGCYTYCYETYTFQMGDTVIGSYDNRWQSDSHHIYEYTYVFNDETNQNCEAGVYVTQTCRNCDYNSQWSNSHHGTFTFLELRKQYDCCENHSIYVYGCPCGEEYRIEFDSSTFVFDEQSQLYTCPDCALTVAYSVTDEDANCLLTRTTSIVVKLANEELYSGVQAETFINHNFADVKVTVNNDATTVTATCQKCGEKNVIDTLVVELEDHDGTWYYDYYFTPDTTAIYTVKGMMGNDTYVTLYEVVDSELVEIDRNDDGWGNQFFLSRELTAGTTYVYRIRFYSSSNSGNINFIFKQGELQRNSECSHNNKEFAILLDGSQSCEDGSAYGRICKACGFVEYVQVGNSHTRVRKEYYDLTKYGACYGYFYIDECACGENRYVNRYHCSLSYVSQTTYTDSQGVEHTTVTEACSTCGLTRVYDYYEQREGCYTYRNYTYTYQIGDTVICSYVEKIEQQEHHVYEYTYVFDDEANKDCEAGVTVTQTCRNCDYHSEWHSTSHNRNLVERYDLTEYGACYGYLRFYECPCGESPWYDVHYCGLDYVSGTTYTDAEGREHTEEIHTCATCGLTRVLDYYDQREGCYVYRYYTYTFKMGDTVIGSYTEKSEQNSYHHYEYVYVFNDETNKNCESGVTVTRTCRDCDYYNEYYRWYHNVDLVERYELSDFGACYGYVRFYACPCGESHHKEIYNCNLNYVSETTYTDADGIEHTVRTDACSICGLTRTYDYYDQREGCYTYRYRTYTYKMGDTVIVSYEEKSLQSEHHVYEYIYVFDDEANQNCEAGVLVIITCRDCDYYTESHRTYHSNDLVERHDLTEYGACYGYLHSYKCPCGESGWHDWNYCSLSYVSETTYTDADGIEHTVRTDACSTCGLTRTYDYYDQREGCYTYRYYTYTFEIGNVVIGSYQEKSQQSEHHVYEYTYVFDDEANRTCEAGVYVTQTCRNCDHRDEWHNYYHGTFLVERYEFVDYGACYGHLYIYKCPCGKESSYNSHHCGLGYVSNTTYTDVQGREHHVETYACSTCGLTRTYDYYDQREGCYTYRYYTYTFEIDNAVIGSYQGKSQQSEHHVYEYTYVFDDEANRNCEAGVYVTQTCRNCDHRNEWHNYYHDTFLVERYEFADYGACYGYLRFYECPCGENRSISVSRCSMSTVSQETYVDANGITHTVQTAACSTCGLTRVRDYYDQREGCYTYRYNTYTFKMGNTVIGSYQEKSQQSEHHVYEYTYVFDDETNRNCEAGVYVTQTCRNCDWHSEWHNSYHGTFLVERYEFADYGACGGYLNFYACACGENRSTSVSRCSMNTVSQETYVDAKGITHTVSTEACSTCGLTRVRDYYNQREGCYTYRYNTYTFKMGNTVIGSYQEKSQQNEYHVYEYTYVFDDETNRNCEAGVYVTQTCRNCDWHSEWHNSYHDTFLVERYEFADYGACRGYLRFYACACGESSYVNTSCCNLSYVSESTYTDADGVEHTVRTDACSTCGLTRVGDYYEQREGCYTYRYYTYTYKMGNTVIGSYEEKSQSGTHHQYEYTYVFDDETNKNCEAGVTIMQTCRNCDYRSEYHRTYHSTNLVEQYDLTDYGADGGYVYIYECPCGYSTGLNVGPCSHGFTYTSENYTDESGTRWYVETRVSTCDCKIRYDRAYYQTYDRENCTKTTHYFESVVAGDTIIKIYNHTNNEEQHDYEVTVSLAPGATSCTEGVTATYVCRYCDYSHTNNYSWHNTYEKERIDMAQYGSVCGGYISIYGCACGLEGSWYLDNCDCGFEQRGTNHWVQGDINDGQYTADGWNSFYTNSYIFTCFVTNPEKCGFVVRHSNYWRKNSDCTATHYVTIQFGYDEATGTYLDERTIRLETRTYHNYESSQIQNGTKYECPDCGSYYTECYYYNENGAHIKTEYIYVNTLDDGRNQHRQETYEYFAEAGYRWNGHYKKEYHKTIGADGSEYWSQYEHTYADYTAPFGENAYKHTRVYTDSNGSTNTYEWAYTDYKGYQFHLYEHYTAGNYWSKYDYTYSFTDGCLRTCVYTTSGGDRRVTTDEAHPTWYNETILSPTCTQFGLYAYRCPICDETRDGQAIRPTAHNWILLPTGIYYCHNCGLQNTNGASGSIVMEDFTEKYGNGTAYVVGYWQRIPIAFTPYVTIYLHNSVTINGVPEQSFVLDMSEDQFHFVNDEYYGLYVNIVDIEAAVAELCELYGVATFTPDMYDVAITFVPDGADGQYDYAIVFGNLIGSDSIDYVIREDEFVTDYVSEGGYVEYTVVSDVTTEWVFESYAGADTYVHLFDENGDQVACDDDSAGYDNNFRLVYTLEAGKTYTVRVRWYSDQNMGYIPVAFDKK